MPTGAERRVEADIAELDAPGTTPQLANQPTDPPKPLENGKPRRRVEFCSAACCGAFFALLMVPYQVKKGQDWYSVVHSLVLFSTIVLTTCIFWGNTHMKMLAFLSGKKIFWKVVVLALIDWVRIMIKPDVGWEVPNRISFSTVFVFRLLFICLDSLKGVSRWFRLFITFFFFVGNFWAILQAYFFNAAQTLYVISATNTTITTNDVQASVATTLVTLTAAIIVTVWHDKDFQYSASYRSYLPKLAVETLGVEPGSAEMDRILEERDAAAAAWRGRPKKSAQVIMVSVVVSCVSIILSATHLADSDSGNESVAMLVLRGTALVLGGSGSCTFFFENTNWRRFKYTFSSPQGILWMFYTLIFALAGLAKPSTVGNVLGTLYTTLGFMVWLSFESVQQISRATHVTITCITALTLAVTIYLSAFVWQDDEVLADLNGVGVPGTLTKYAVQRTCLVNLSLLMAGSLITVVKKNLTLNSYFMLVEGNVLRREMLEAESTGVKPDGDNDFIVFNSLNDRLSRHDHTV